MNKWIGVFRLTKDAVVRYTEGAEPKAIARFTGAVDRKYKKDAEQTADFVSMVSFGKTAEFIEKYGKKGTKFVGEGRIQTGSYEKDGQKIYTTDVVIENVEFAESKASTQETGKTAAKTESVASDFIDIPDGIDGELPFV